MESASAATVRDTSSVEVVPSGYTLRRDLGRGRLGRGLACTDDASGREVFIRVLDVGAPTGLLRAALESELAAAAAASRHPCAVPIEAWWVDGRAGFCIRQPLRPGGSAAALLAAGSAWQVEDVVLVGARAAAALSASHRMGVLHLDVRPANLLADSSGAWSLANGALGGALVRSGRPVQYFDPRYAPRELAGWEQPGPACDVFGLGATLLALLRDGAGDGAPPANSARPGIPSGLSALLARMTAADPSARPPLAEVERAFRSHLGPAAVGRISAAEGPAVQIASPLPVRQLAASLPDLVDDGASERRRKTLVGAVGVAVLFVGASVVAVASLEDDGKDADAEQVAAAVAPVEQTETAEEIAPPPEPEPEPELEPEPEKPVAPVVNPARLRPLDVPSAQRKARLVSDITLAVTGDQITVAWAEPNTLRDVSGYVVEFTRKEDKKVFARQYVPYGQVNATFTNPPATPGSCVAVSTLVDYEDDIRIARGDRQCKPVAKAFGKTPKAGTKR